MTASFYVPWRPPLIGLQSSPVSLRRVAVALLFVSIAIMALAFSFAPATAQSSVRPPAGASLPAVDPGSTATTPAVAPASDPTSGRGARYDKQIWGAVRHSGRGLVTIPDGNSAVLVQSDGWKWMLLRNGDLPRYSGWALGGMVVLLAVFFLIFGRIKIKSGWSGATLPRFSTFERAGHWLLAVSFIILAITGLNVLYGKALLMPLVGKGAFAALSATAKLLHNYVAFAFMAGLAIIFLMWVLSNFPNRHDIMWLLKGGGMFAKDGHVSAKKFNAGQKILFWLIIFSGLSISLSGIALMFPFQTAMFAKTFAILNIFGAGLSTTLSPIQEMQYATTWHAIMAIFMTCIILGHIYIGTIGMQGAFSAMGSGDVDVNWAKEHHDLWAEEMLADRELKDASGAKDSAGLQPAE